MATCTDLPELSPSEHGVLRALSSAMKRRGNLAVRNSCWLTTREIARLSGQGADVVVSCVEGLEHVGAISREPGDGEHLLLRVQSPCFCQGDRPFSSSYTERRADSYLNPRLRSKSVTRSSSSTSAGRFADTQAGQPRYAHLQTQAFVWEDSPKKRTKSNSGRNGSVTEFEPVVQRGWGDIDGRRATARATRERQLAAPVGEWSARTFATYFARQASSAPRLAKDPGQVNFGALAKGVNTWLAETALTPEEVKLMIDWFFMNLERYVQRGTPPWLCFLRAKSALATEAVRIRQGQEMEENRYNPDWWLKRSEHILAKEALRNDEDYWLGRKKEKFV